MNRTHMQNLWMLPLSLLLAFATASAEEKAEAAAENSPKTLSAEVKAPDSVAITAEQAASVTELKAAREKMAELEKKVNELAKDYQANREELTRLRQQMREPQQKLNGARDVQPDIALELVIKNSGDDDQALLWGGDSTRLEMALEGPVAVNLPYNGMMTMEFRMGKRMTIKAGETLTLRLKGLRYGQRDMSRWLIGAPGEYTLRVTLHSRTSMGRGGSAVVVHAKPVTLKVVKAEAQAD